MKLTKFAGGMAAVWVIVAIIAAGYFGVFEKLGIGGAAAPAVPSTQTSVSTLAGCPDSSVTATIGPTSRRYSAATSMADVYTRVFVNGVDQGLKRDSATMTVKPGDNMEVYYAENDTLYWGSKAVGKAPCGAFSTAADLDGDAENLWPNTTFTMNVFNPSNGNLNAITDNETFIANQPRNFNVEFTGASDRAFSPYGDVLVLVEANATQFDLTKTSLQGGTKTIAPSSTVYKTKHIDNGVVVFRFPGGPKGSERIYNIYSKLYMEAKNVDPVHSTGTVPNPINITLLCEDWYQDPLDKTEKYGLENVNGVQVCGGNPGYGTPSQFITYN